MREIEERKSEALSSLLCSYEFYKGGFESSLEKNIKELKKLIDEEIYYKLFQSFEKYKYDILSVLARSKRVFVKFVQNEISPCSSDDCDDKFYELDDFE